MSPPSPLDSALKRVQPRWSDARAAAAHHGLQRKRRRRRAARVALTVLLVGLAGGGVWRAASPRTAPVVEPVRDQPMERPPAMAFQVENADGSAPVFAQGNLSRGKVRLTGSGVLRAGAIEVAVLQARVLVDRVDASSERITVIVEEGEAIVRWDGEERRLGAGESATVGEPERQQQPPPSSAAPKKVRPPSGKRWRQLAEQGDFEGAWVEMRDQRQLPKDEPEELLLAADVARLSRHPAEAIAPLQQVIARHPRDPRAPLAAFTLGRTLLEELGQPAEAARAFRTARTMAPKGTLADDALAREVEAQARAGNTSEARKLAEEYLKRLPDGPRARLVRHHGGLE